MLADSYIVPRCLIASRSLGGLLTLYEANFIKLRALLVDLPVAGTCLVSRTPLDMDLHLRVEDSSRFTQELRLTYLFADHGRLLPEPDLRLRLYLDARLAEVRGWSVSQRHGVLRSLYREVGREIDRRWAANVILGKWLDYLCDRGHSFVGEPDPAPG